MKSITIILLTFLLNFKSYGQDTIQLDKKNFYKISTTAFGKAIVYSQRNVQLKTEGNFKFVSKDGEASFSLNKNFYVNGNWVSKDSENRKMFTKYIDGTQVYSEEIYGDNKRIDYVTVILKGKDYFIAKYKINYEDSIIEKFKNRKPILLAKYRNGKLILQNDIIKKTVVIYDNYGNLEEKHYNNVEEKYSSKKDIYYKKVYLKNRTEEYKDGIINKVYEYKVDKSKRNIVVLTIYDENGNKKDSTESEQSYGAEVAPEYMLFDLDLKEFEAYKSIANKS